MSTKTELLEAHKAMLTLLDAKIGHMAEWKAFRAIDRALLAIDEQGPNGAAPPNRARFRQRAGHPASYTELTDRALQSSGKPIPTPLLIEFVRGHRELGDDIKRATINVTSSLSKSDRFRSVPWEGGRAWWYADRPVPKRETASS